MKQKTWLIFFCFLFSIINIYSQEKKQDAHANIVMLKRGALLVRLKTSDLAISSLKAQGKNEEAEEIRKAQEKENKEIVEAFKNKFDFCPVYFFASLHSTEIKNGDCNGFIHNTDYQHPSGFSCKDFLVGEFDDSETTHIEGFIIKNKNYEQLSSPFPFLIKKNSSLVKTRSKADIVAELNSRLHDFWAKNQ